MNLVEEIKPEHPLQLRHTWVTGRDTKHYKVITVQLYETQPPPEFPNWEVNVQEVDERGKWRVLIQPVLKRFFDRRQALMFHQELLEKFDEALKLQEPVKKGEHKPAPAGGH